MDEPTNEAMIVEICGAFSNAPWGSRAVDYGQPFQGCWTSNGRPCRVHIKYVVNASKPSVVLQLIILRQPHVRIVTVSSEAINMLPPARYPLQFDSAADLSCPGITNPAARTSRPIMLKRYVSSKAANALSATELQRRLDAENVHILLIRTHPGAVVTDGGSGIFGAFLQPVARLPMARPLKGARRRSCLLRWRRSSLASRQGDASDSTTITDAGYSVRTMRSRCTAGRSTSKLPVGHQIGNADARPPRRREIIHGAARDEGAHRRHRLDGVRREERGHSVHAKLEELCGLAGRDKVTLHRKIFAHRRLFAL
ncbi:hypothetical protein Egran_05269 [Elaphomyces granulatus]|uniref:Uncharacterized protein n=1 Tax=Elaphomyces granulatus TaxID=519963 RepID=A0A232LSA7_9EURO|nr:hypothetical protein Egran_05269 [Elaphomyces granulatus]